MIDFTSAVEELNGYKGSEKKKTLIYDGKRYLVKFPDPIRERNKNISYINNAFSEYVGSNIFKIIGYDVQNTLLGKYTYNGREKIVCACEDFTSGDSFLYEFESLVLSINPDKKIDTELSDIMDVIDKINELTQINIIVIDDIKEKFWDMFIIDALIGNTDRHNGNWGILVNTRCNEARFSPVYDCGSCLNPMLEDEEIKELSDSDLKNLALNCYSCLKENGKKINYMLFMESLKNENCNAAIERVFNVIDINKINKFIDSILCMSEVRRDFYKKIIYLRYKVIEKSYKKLKMCE
jgi:hypothetical protein